MIATLRRVAPIPHGIAIACVPFFPGFITLTAVAFPGVSIVPLPLALALLGAMGLLGIYGIASLVLVKHDPSPLRAPLVTLTLVMLLCALLGFNPRDGFVFLGILALSMIWHGGIAQGYAWPNVARTIWWSYLLSGIFACVLAIGMVVTRVPAAQYAIAHGRAVGTFVLPGELAGYLILFVPIAYALARVAHSPRLRAVAWAAFALGGVTMALTFSRTGWVGLASAVAALVTLGSRRKKRGALVGAAIVLAALVLVLALFNEHHNPSENYTRLSIWQAALATFDRFPLTGVGPFGFSHIYPAVRLPDGDETAFHAHSLYLTFAVELGVAGLAALAWILVTFGRAMRRGLATAEPAAFVLASAIAAGLIGALVQGLIDTVSVFIFGLLFPMLALALAAARAGTAGA
ncbi:MAG: O-antigen ligase family protein [bacterium]|nr:O-antigen ligase family protein [bacterium]